MPKLLRISALVCVLAISAFAQTIDPSINDKIRAEEKDHSQIMHTMHYLADVYGPRLTGSPNHKAAADWAVKEMTSWGFANAPAAMRFLHFTISSLSRSWPGRPARMAR